jgi:hypothetical protein
MQKEGQCLLNWIDVARPNDVKAEPSTRSSPMTLFLNAIDQGKEIEPSERIKMIVLF